MKNYKKIHITEKHTGKMEGMVSVSTSPTMNRHCLERIKNGNKVCAKCYSFRMHKRFNAKFAKAFEENTKVLTESVIPKTYLPVIDADDGRLESFGDLNNEIQVINYFNICKKNKYTKFALWTKNPWYIEKAIDIGYKKPKNLVIVYSSEYMNVIADWVFERYDFVDKVFTVFDKKYVKENNVEINCGANKCKKCLTCYRKNKIKYINELVK